MERLTRGQVAERTGVGSEALRYYERKGLLPEPPRTPSGYRQYPPEVVYRIRFIRRAQEIGFSLSEVAELLELRVDPKTDCRDVRARALAKLQEVDAKVRDLERMRGILSDLASACAGEGPTTDCPILESLELAEEGAW